MSPKRLARIAGVLYLLNGVSGAFAFGYVIGKVYVPGDAATTTANVMANADLVRFGAVADLFAATVWIFLAMTLYMLLKHVQQALAGALVVLVAIGAAIMGLNDVFQFASVRIATEGSSSAVAAIGTSGLVLLLLDLHHYGYLIAQIFFGLWLVPFGLLAYRSAMLPRTIGVALIVGGACYLAGMLAVFLVPGSGEKINTFVTIPSAIAEVLALLYLLVIGVRSPVKQHPAPTGSDPELNRSVANS